MSAIEQLVAIAEGRLQHRYTGECPEASRPHSRDPQCEACKALAAVALHEGEEGALRDAARYRYIRGVASGEPGDFGKIEDAAFAAHSGDPAQFDFNIDAQMAALAVVHRG